MANAGKTADAALGQCSVCGKPTSLKDSSPVGTLPGDLRAKLPETGTPLTADSRICAECEASLHGEYFHGVLQDSMGELDQLEHEVLLSLKHQKMITSNVNEEFEDKITFGQRIADKVASFGGSWTFIGLFGVILAIWIMANQFMSKHAFDPYPFILLNLCLSCIAAIQAPVIMMSQNRHSAKDRLHAEQDYQVNLKAELQIRHLHDIITLLAARQHESLEQLRRLEAGLQAGRAVE